MRVFAILATLAMTALVLVPAAAAHWDSSSTDPCPPSDIRWWFDHVHKSCCPPLTTCPHHLVGPLTRAPVLP